MCARTGPAPLTTMLLFASVVVKTSEFGCCAISLPKYGAGLR